MKQTSLSACLHASRSIWFTASACLLLTGTPVLAQAVKPEKASASCAVKAYGAKGDGIALDTAAVNAAIEDCHAHGGGTVVIEAGTYRTGTIHLLDNITLNLAPGSTVLGSDDLADYTHLSRSSEERDTALMVAENVHNVAVVGEGTIDGNGRAFTDTGIPHFHPYFEAAQTRQGQAFEARMAEAREGPVRMRARPGLLLLVLHSDGVILRDFHVIESPNWSIHVACSNHISVSGLDVRNSLLVPNADAIDVSASSNVTITNSYLEAGDDALVLGGPCADGWCQQTMENVAVSNVILRSRSAAIRIGPSAKGVRNMTLENVVIRDSNRGINIQARGGELVENLLFSNIVSETRLIDGPWWGAGEPVSITAARWAYPSWQGAPQQTSGGIRHIMFNDMIANSQSPIVIYSTEPGLIEDVGFRDLKLTMQSSALQPILGGNLDLQPATPMSVGVVRHDLSAMELHDVRDVTLTGLEVHWEGSFPEFYRNAIHAESFDGLTIDGFKGEGSVPSYAALSFQQGKNLSVHNAQAFTGALWDSKGMKSSTTSMPKP
jgi:Glycosyl hydrolases family 28